MKSPADIITRLQMMAQDGTKSDRRLASMVLSEPDFVSKAAISEIAARAAISEPTVTRFCRSLGCEGLRDFKFYLAQAIGNILCVGSGGISSMMATEMQNRLFRLGLSALAQVDGQLQRMYASVATPETTVVAFSVSGYARSTVEAVQVARQYGAVTVAVTPPESALAKAAETVIPFQAVEDGNIYKPTSSRYALLAILDIIATATAEARGSKALENLRRIKQSVNTLKVADPRLPLGD